MYKGIDISHHQGDIDYQAVKNSGEIDFVILKAGGSDDGFYEDSKFRDYLDGFRSADIPILGAYYFVGSGCVSEGDGIADADRLCDILDGTGIKYAILDLESTDPSDIDGATEASIGFMDRCIERGYNTMIYASDISGFQNRLHLDRLDKYKKWVARYGSEPQYVSDYAIWQYSSAGSIPGISARVDMNYLYDTSLLSENDTDNSDNGREWSREQALAVTDGFYHGLLFRGYDGQNEAIVHGLEYDMTRIEAFDSIRNSDEYKKKQLIEDCYMCAKGSLPSYEEADFWLHKSDDEIKQGILYSDDFNTRYNV